MASAGLAEQGWPLVLTSPVAELARRSVQSQKALLTFVRVYQYLLTFSEATRGSEGPEVGGEAAEGGQQPGLATMPAGPVRG
jgi:hypothetical protein